MKNVAIYCGSSSGISTKYTVASQAMAHALVEKNIGIVYGAGSVGLMGVIADEILSLEGEVHGVIPQFLMDMEVGHTEITRLEVVSDMHIRKARMVELSDGFIAMPGGFGTLDEIFEVLTWKQLGLHDKPVGFYNVDGYFDSLLVFMKDMVMKGFLKSIYVERIIVSSDPEELLDNMINHKSIHVGGKWL